MQADELNPWYQRHVSVWASQFEVEQTQSQVKSRTRAIEKIARSYAGDACRVTDFVRSTITANTVDQLARFMKFLVSSPSVRIHTVNNRFDTSYDSSQTGGYRDINMKLSF